MLNNVMNLEDLKAEAVRIKHKQKIIVFWPQFNKHQEQAYSLTDDYCISERIYNINNGIIAFYEQEALYVIPFFHKAIDILEEEGFHPSDMLVPFSNREYPIEEKEHWEMMNEEAKELLEESYRKECLEYAAQMGVTPIDQKLLDEVCILIPEEGIVVNHPDKEDERKFPIISGYCCDAFTVEHLGMYFVNVRNGIITFVNADGVQYITKSETVHRQLLKKGYQFRKFDEIIGEDEEPADDEIMQLWEKLTIA